MRHGLTTIQEDRDFIAREDAAQRFCVTVQRADEHGGFAVTATGADEAADFARGERGFGFGIRAGE